MIFFALKLLVGYAVILALNWAWPRLKLKFFPGLRNLAPRWQLLQVALSDLDWLPIAIVVFGTADALAWAGGLTGPGFLMDHQGTFPTFVLWVLDPTFLNLAGSFLVAAVLGFGSGCFGFSVLLSVALLFPGILTVPGAAALIFGEMAGASLRHHLKVGNHAAALRTLVAVVSFLIFWAGGTTFRDLLQSLEFNPMQVNDRLIESLILISGLCFVDTFLSMIAFHFYFHWSHVD